MAPREEAEPPKGVVDDSCDARARDIAAELQERLAVERRALGPRRHGAAERADAQALDEQNQTLRGKLVDMTTLVTNLEAQMRECHERAERAEAGTRRLREQAKRAERERAEAESYAGQAHRETKRLETELEAVLEVGERQREMCAATLESSAQEKHAHAELLRRAREEAEETVRRATSDTQRLRDLGSDLRGQLEEERERGDQLAEKLRQMTTKIVDLDEKLAKERERGRGLEQKLAGAQRPSLEQHRHKQQHHSMEPRSLLKLEALQTMPMDDPGDVRIGSKARAAKASTPMRTVSRDGEPLQDVRDERDALHALLVSSQRQCNELRAEVSKIKSRCRSMEVSQSSCWHESDAPASARSHPPASARSSPDMHVTMEQTWQRITHDMQEQLSATEGQLGLAQEQRKCAEHQRDLAEQKLNAEQQCKEEAEGLVHALEQEILLLEGTIRKEQQRDPGAAEDGELLAAPGGSARPGGASPTAGGLPLSASGLATDSAGWPVWPACGREGAGGKDAVRAGGCHGTSQATAGAGMREDVPEFLDEPEGEFEPASQPASPSEGRRSPLAPQAGRETVEDGPGMFGRPAMAVPLPRSRSRSDTESASPRSLMEHSGAPPLQEQACPVPAHGGGAEPPLSGGERRRLRKLAVENVALIDANHRTRMLLDEMTSRLRRMRDIAEERGQPKVALLAEIAETAGLGEVFGSAPRNVFERLYWDGLLRLRRLEEVTRKIHEEERSEMLHAAGSSDMGPRSAALAAQTRAVLARFDGQRRREGGREVAAASASAARPDERGGGVVAGEATPSPSPSHGSGAAANGAGSSAGGGGSLGAATAPLPAVASSPTLTPFGSPCSQNRGRRPKKPRAEAARFESMESFQSGDGHPSAPSAQRPSPTKPPMLVSSLQRCRSSKAKLCTWWGGSSAALVPGAADGSGRVAGDASTFVLPALPRSSSFRGSSLSAAHRPPRSGKTMLR